MPEENQSQVKNDFGSDLWVRPNQLHRYPTAGRGLFAGLQDMKHYNVDDGFARRKSGEAHSGVLGHIWDWMSGGAYRPPEQDRGDQH